MTNKLLKPEQIEEIERKVNDILAEHVVFDQWEILKKTAQKEGIIVELAKLQDVSGILFKNDQGIWSIRLNEEDSIKRRLFTFAHELGHYFLHKEDGNKFIDSQFGPVCFGRAEGTKFQEIELEANEFAGILIMPKSIIDREIEVLKKELGKEKIDSDLITRLAEIFGVSSVAMVTRLKNLEYV